MKINGWLFVDKPEGISSRKVVDLISNSLLIKKVGHAGTLDPMASGLLPIAIGEATKTIGVIQQFQKCYKFVVKWGEKTSTDDKIGTTISSTNVRPSLQDIQKNLKKFVGKIEQIPPKFSAIKVNGVTIHQDSLNFIDRLFEKAKSISPVLGCLFALIFLAIFFSVIWFVIGLLDDLITF